jgi:hypothetical protein
MPKEAAACVRSAESRARQMIVQGESDPVAAAGMNRTFRDRHDAGRASRKVAHDQGAARTVGAENERHLAAESGFVRRSDQRRDVESQQLRESGAFALELIKVGGVGQRAAAANVEVPALHAVRA